MPPDSMALSVRSRIRVVATILVGLVVGGVAGAGVANGWYGPAVGVGVAVIVGLAVGRQVFVVAREARRSNGRSPAGGIVSRREAGNLPQALPEDATCSISYW